MSTLHRVTFLGTMPDGEDFASGFHYYSPTSLSDQDVADAFATAITARWTTDMDDKSSDQFHLTGVRADQRNVASGTVVSTASAALGLVGTVSLALPSTVAIVISQRTGLSGPSYRGRMYWGGIASNQCTNVGAIQPLCVAEVLDFFGDLYVAGKTDLGYGQMVVYSEKLRTTTNVVQLAVGNGFDTQRRRANRRRESYSSRSI